MKRILVFTLFCLLSVPAAHAQDNPFATLWPFGKDKAETPSFKVMNPFVGTRTATGQEDKTFGIPSPTEIIDKAEEKTGAAFQKTRETWKGVQDFGKSLNPFTAKPTTKQRGPKKSLLDTIFPKQPVQPSSPATVNDFLKLDRPKF